MMLFLFIMIYRPWCESTFQDACQTLLSDLRLSSNAPGGMPEYRCSLVISFFFKFYLSVLSQLGEGTLPIELVSATQPFKRGVARSSQGFQRVPSQQLQDDTIGRPVMHLSALQQATGEARYMCLCEIAILTLSATVCYVCIHLYSLYIGIQMTSHTLKVNSMLV